MDPQLLRHFVAAAHHLHFAHAAKELGVPRSTVVASVRVLEDRLGYDLFDKTAMSTVLTPEGETYLVDAERQLKVSAAAAARSAPAPGGKAKASKGKGRAPAVKGARKPGRPRQGR